MQSLEPVVNYLVDPNSGLKQVITEFLNAVMLFEAYLQSGALPYERSPQRKAHRNGTRSRTLKDRGLEGVELVISDAHKGIQKAVESSFVGASWQYCHVHNSRAVLESIPNKDKEEIADKLKETSDDEMKMQELAKELRDRGYDPAAETIDWFRFDLWNYKAYPKAHWKRI